MSARPSWHLPLAADDRLDWFPAFEYKLAMRATGTAKKELAAEAFDNHKAPCHV
jgi:hypothetical protein